MSMAHDDLSDDDGFGDFLSEDEEECALQVQEMAALERKMKTVRVRSWSAYSCGSFCVARRRLWLVSHRSSSIQQCGS